MTASGVPIKITPGGGIEVAKKAAHTPAKGRPAVKPAVKKVAPAPAKAPVKAAAKLNEAKATKKVVGSTAAQGKPVSKGLPAKAAAPRKLTM